MDNNLIDVIQAHWTEILQSVKQDSVLGMSDVSYNTWLLPLKVSSVEDNTFIITSSDSNYSYDYVKIKYGPHLKVAISEFFGHDYDIEFKTQDDIRSEAIKTINRTGFSSELNPIYTFENFISGTTSDLAFKAALAVAESPGEIYNPLFIHGDAGLGKTHLMQAIGNFIINKDPSKRVLYVTSEAFTNEIVKAIREGRNNPEETRNKYRNVDVLLIDDIQFIIGKETTQEEFFNTFNALREAKKQIVISADKPPKEFTTLDDRLRSRFESGLTVDIQPPTYEIRMAILKKKLSTQYIDINEEILNYIAENITTNVRELEGSLNKIIALSKLQHLGKDDITLDLAKNALQNIIATTNKKKVDINYIAEIVAEHFGITLNDIYSKNRSRNVAYPRFIIMYLGSKLTSLSSTEIGVQLGNRDHSTILHGIQKIEEDIAEDKNTEDMIDILIKKINPQ